MAIQKTEAILLKRQDLRETSLLLVAFTKHLGKIVGLVKGVRGARAVGIWYLEPLTLQAMVLYERRRSPVALISSCDLLDPFDGIRRDLSRISYASYCLDLVDAMTQTWDPHPEIFEGLLGTLRAIEEGADPRSMARSLEVQLLRLSGILPDPDSLSLSPGAQLSLKQILSTPPEKLGRLRLSPAVEGELKALLQNLSGRLVEHPLKSRIFLHALGMERPVATEREATIAR